MAILRPSGNNFLLMRKRLTQPQKVTQPRVHVPAPATDEGANIGGGHPSAHTFGTVNQERAMTVNRESTDRVEK